MHAESDRREPELIKGEFGVTKSVISATRPVQVPIRALWLLALSIGLLIAQAMIAQARPDSFADLAQKVSPSVVNITTSTMVEGNAGASPLVPEGSPFEDFFERFRDQMEEGNRPRRSSALGSGFVISEDGFVVTNNHVIEGADEINIEFFSGKTLPAKVIGTDPKTDIAVLKVESDTPLPYVTFGDSDTARVGDWVLAMGNPLGRAIVRCRAPMTITSRPMRRSTGAIRVGRFSTSMAKSWASTPRS
jgi:serine protease Do